MENGSIAIVSCGLTRNTNNEWVIYGYFCESYDNNFIDFFTFPRLLNIYDSYRTFGDFKPSFIRENNPDKNFGHPDDVPYGRYIYYDWEQNTSISSIYIDVYPTEA